MEVEVAQLGDSTQQAHRQSDFVQVPRDGVHCSRRRHSSVVGKRAIAV